MCMCPLSQSQHKMLQSTSDVIKLKGLVLQSVTKNLGNMEIFLTNIIKTSINMCVGNLEE